MTEPELQTVYTVRMYGLGKIRFQFEVAARNEFKAVEKVQQYLKDAGHDTRFLEPRSKKRIKDGLPTAILV
jgi:hypothetical protein